MGRWSRFPHCQVGRKLGGWLSHVALVASVMCLACNREEPNFIAFSLASPAVDRRFAAVTSLAEYLDLPGETAEVRLVLANYRFSCEHFRVPEGDEILVTVLLTVPRGQPLAPAEIPSERAQPTVRIGKDSWTLPPGGHLRVHRAAVERGGKMAGLLDFEFPGTAELSASRLAGAFQATFCPGGAPP